MATVTNEGSSNLNAGGYFHFIGRMMKPPGQVRTPLAHRGVSGFLAELASGFLSSGRMFL